jgi:hypothetical protein
MGRSALVCQWHAVIWSCRLAICRWVQLKECRVWHSMFARANSNPILLSSSINIMFRPMQVQTSVGLPATRQRSSVIAGSLQVGLSEPCCCNRLSEQALEFATGLLMLSCPNKQALSTPSLGITAEHMMATR